MVQVNRLQQPGENMQFELNFSDTPERNTLKDNAAEQSSRAWERLSCPVQQEELLGELIEEHRRFMLRLEGCKVTPHEMHQYVEALSNVNFQYIMRFKPKSYTPWILQNCCQLYELCSRKDSEFHDLPLAEKLACALRAHAMTIKHRGLELKEHIDFLHDALRRAGADIFPEIRILAEARYLLEYESGCNQQWSYLYLSALITPVLGLLSSEAKKELLASILKETMASTPDAPQFEPFAVELGLRLGSDRVLSNCAPVQQQLKVLGKIAAVSAQLATGFSLEDCYKDNMLPGLTGELDVATGNSSGAAKEPNYAEKNLKFSPAENSSATNLIKTHNRFMARLTLGEVTPHELGTYVFSLTTANLEIMTQHATGTMQLILMKNWHTLYTLLTDQNSETCDLALAGNFARALRAHAKASSHSLLHDNYRISTLHRNLERAGTNAFPEIEILADMRCTLENGRKRADSLNHAYSRLSALIIPVLGLLSVDAKKELLGSILTEARRYKPEVPEFEPFVTELRLRLLSDRRLYKCAELAQQLVELEEIAISSRQGAGLYHPHDYLDDDSY